MRRESLQIGSDGASAAEDLSAALPQIDPDGVYGAVQVAGLLATSKRTVRRWRVSGVRAPTGERIVLTGFRAGTWRVTGRSLIEFLRALQPADRPTIEPMPRPRRRSGVDAALKEAGF